MTSLVLPLCIILNFLSTETVDLELKVERLGRSITSLKPSFISDSIRMVLRFAYRNLGN
jgi:hypothetical protein